MKNHTCFTLLLAALLIMAGLAACHDDKEPDIPVFVENAGILENGQTLSPGAIVHLEGRGNTRWISGFIIVRDKSENGCRSLFYTVDENGSFAKEPIAQYPNKALSAAANHDRPGTLTVHFEASRAGNVTEEYSFEKQEWTSVNEFGTFDEIVWIN